MKASEIAKESISIEIIYKEIEDLVKGNKHVHKHFVPHVFFISDYVKARLINDGFKIYSGEYCKGDYGLIIEW